MKPGAGDNSDANSPSSVISSVFLEPLATKAKPCEKWVRVERELEKDVVEVEGGGASDSSFVIEIDSHGVGDSEGAAAVDEAIAWAKEKFRWNPMPNGFEVRDETQDTMGGRGEAKVNPFKQGD